MSEERYAITLGLGSIRIVRTSPACRKDSAEPWYFTHT